MKDQGLLPISTTLGKQWLMRFRHLHNELRSENRKSERGPSKCPKQCSWSLQVRWGCTAIRPAVDGNWTEQVPSVILVGEEDKRGDARLWGCRTVETTWLTTHSQIHYRACQSVNEAPLWPAAILCQRHCQLVDCRFGASQYTLFVLGGGRSKTFHSSDSTVALRKLKFVKGVVSNLFWSTGWKKNYSAIGIVHASCFYLLYLIFISANFQKHSGTNWFSVKGNKEKIKRNKIKVESILDIY